MCAASGQKKTCKYIKLTIKVGEYGMHRRRNGKGEVKGDSQGGLFSGKA